MNAKMLNLLGELTRRLLRQTEPLTAEQLESLEYARRGLRRLAKRTRKEVREDSGTTGPVVIAAVESALRVARSALDGEPWGVACDLRGAAGIHYTATHAGPNRPTVRIDAPTLDALLRGIDAVELPALDEDHDHERMAA